MKKIILLFVSICVSCSSNYDVIKVIDGDTLKVSYNNRIESVRLIGIDTPEVYFTKDNAKGKAASAFVKSIVKPGDIVKLEFDMRIRDRYNRLLAYVYLDNGKMLNEIIIREGFAEVMTIKPNIKYKKQFISGYEFAKKNKKGLFR